MTPLEQAKTRQGSGPPEDQNSKMRLLEAGTALFAEKGYAATSVREIVDLAGVTKPVLYYYFTNKEGLFRAILDWAAQLQERLLEEVAQTSGPVLDRLMDLYGRTYEGVLEHQNLFKLIHGLIFGPPQAVPEYDLHQYHRRMVAAIKTLFAEGVARGEARDVDPEDAAILVLGLIDFSFHMVQLDNHSMDPERLKRLLTLAFQGLSRKDGSPDAAY